MDDILDDPKTRLAAAMLAQSNWAPADAIRVRDTMRDLSSRLVESKAAVARSRALLDKLNARKPPAFP